MTSQQTLFDDTLRTKRRRRAERIGFADFLHEEAAGIIRERLEEVNKTLTSVAVITGFAPVWAKSFPRAEILSDETEPLALSGPYDLVIHGLSAHGLSDPVGQFIQIRRALRNDGLMIAAMFGGQTLHELRACLAEAETEMRGGIAPRVSPMAEIRDLGALISRAGLALPVADMVSLTVTYRDLFALMRDLRAMGETNILAAQDTRFLRRDVLMRAAQIYAQSFPAEGERISATFEIVFLTGWAPDESQQKPLRPGSASARLAEALGTTEIGTGEKPRSD